MQERAWQAVLTALRERVRKNPRGEISALAEDLGTTRGTVSRWLSGNLKGRRIPYDRMRRLMLALGLDPSGYFGEVAEQNEPEGSGYYLVPWLEARASMGGGSLEVSKNIRSHLGFRRDWLLSKGNVNKMVAISVEGDSMYPTIPDGSVVLINEGSALPPVHDKIYLVCYREELFLKRLLVREGRVTSLVSDLDGSQIVINPDEYFNIIGRAIWYGKDL